MARAISVTAMLSAALLAGCGGDASENRVETVPVQGTLTVDGKPHGPASLIFKPIKADGTDDPGRSMSGATTAADGTFTAGTYEEADGLPPGQYEVSIPNMPATDPATMGKPGAAAVSTVPLTIEIPAGGATDLKVDLASGGRKRGGRPGQPLGL